MSPPKPPQRAASIWRDPLILFRVVRSALLLVGLYTFDTLADAPPHENPNLAFYYYGLPAITDPVFGPTIGVWQRCDTNHYLQIVLEGYQTNPRSSAFMPLLPLLAWPLTQLFGSGVLGALIALLLISHAATFGLLLILQQLARDEGLSPAATRFTLAAACSSTPSSAGNCCAKTITTPCVSVGAGSTPPCLTWPLGQCCSGAQPWASPPSMCSNSLIGVACPATPVKASS